MSDTVSPTVRLNVSQVWKPRVYESVTLVYQCTIMEAEC